MTLPAEQLPELQERLTELAEQWLTEEDYIPLMRVDADLDLEDVEPGADFAVESAGTLRLRQSHTLLSDLRCGDEPDCRWWVPTGTT